MIRPTLLLSAAAALLVACYPAPAPTPASARAAAAADAQRPISRIAFGSCNDQDHAQPLWPLIAAGRPDLWVWLGDNVYSDTEDMDKMRADYAKQLADEGYRALLASTPVVGTWDDHDYGVNNGGKEYPRRAESQQLLLDFLGEPADSPRRRQAGVYASHTYGPPGRQVKVILLDTRYHRDPVDTLAHRGDILGEEQWRWLEHELKTSRAQVHVIGSSIQVVPEQHRFEKWANFPAARERLFRLIGEARVSGVVFVSGDRHIAEISRVEGTAAGYPLYDVTSSGLTHTWRTDWPEENRHRLREKVMALNWGVLDIDWDAGALRFEIRDDRNAVRLARAIPLAELQPPAR
jgi:alkaline phosphatase D